VSEEALSGVPRMCDDEEIIVAHIIFECEAYRLCATDSVWNHKILQNFNFIAFYY